MVRGLQKSHVMVHCRNPERTVLSSTRKQLFSNGVPALGNPTVQRSPSHHRLRPFPHRQPRSDSRPSKDVLRAWQQWTRQGKNPPFE
jgi:hypothetical protein